MGPNEKNQNITELKQGVSRYLQKVVLLIGLRRLGLDVKQNTLFITKKRKKGQASLGQTYYSMAESQGSPPSMAHFVLISNEEEVSLYTVGTATYQSFQTHVLSNSN